MNQQSFYQLYGTSALFRLLLWKQATVLALLGFQLLISDFVPSVEPQSTNRLMLVATLFSAGLLWIAWPHPLSILLSCGVFAFFTWLVYIVMMYAG